jgi:hypothetical protein
MGLRWPRRLPEIRPGFPESFKQQTQEKMVGMLAEIGTISHQSPALECCDGCGSFHLLRVCAAWANHSPFLE